MHRAARTSLLVPVVASLLLAACGAKDPSKSEVTADIAAQLVDSGYTTSEAKCVAGVLVDEIGSKEIADVKIDDDEPATELKGQIAAAVLVARDECGIDASGS
jgi:uncharacterized lipoprotein YajG